MSNFKLRVNKFDRKALYPISTYCSEEYLAGHAGLYLTTDLVEDERNQKLHRYYRLHSSESLSIEDALGFEISCPECHRHKLRQIGRILNSHDLGLYVCPDCDKKRSHL